MVGSEVKEMRIEMGLTQAELAEILRLSKSMIQRIELGRTWIGGTAEDLLVSRYKQFQSLSEGELIDKELGLI